MDKKRLIFGICALICTIYSYSQTNYNYQPMTTSQKNEIDDIMLVNSVSNFIINDQIPIGVISLTNVMNMISYNPIEGTRIRLSMQTNNKLFDNNKLLKNRITFSAMTAYGTKDKKFKYAIGSAFNFANKPSSVFGYPCSTLSVNWEDNTYMPSYSNYDVAYFSFGDWDRFYFASKKQLTMAFLQKFTPSFAIRPFVYWQKIDNYWLYDNKILYDLLDNEDYINKAVGIDMSFSPSNNLFNIFNLLNSRFCHFPTQINISYSYNFQKYKTENYYNKAEITAQHRFMFKPTALDVKICGGKIFRKSHEYMYFSPNYMNTTVSNTTGFNLYSPYSITYKEYLQTFIQFNFGGLLLDNIKFFKQFKPNEFVNFKALFTANDKPYYEMGIGFDHIFSFFGVEFVKRIAKDNPFNMPEWAIKIRCNM